MKSFFVDPSDVSFNNDLFGTNRPFEASTTTRSALQMRARRSPDLGSNPISISSHIRGRNFYWFTTDWELIVTNNTFNTIDTTVQLRANHIGGKSIAQNTFIPSLIPNSTFSTTISPTTIGSNNMIMDSSTNPSLNFQVSVFNGSSSVFIQFDWGRSFSESSGGLATLTTTTRTLGTWGTDGGVNVRVDFFDDSF